MDRYVVKLDEGDEHSYTVQTVEAERFEIEGGALVFYTKDDKSTISQPKRTRAFNNWLEVEMK